ERYSVEGFYYALREETYDQAIEKIAKHIELTGEIASHHVLARRLFLLERVDEAITHWEIVTRMQHPLWMAYNQLASAYEYQQRFDIAYELIESFMTRFPDRAEVYAGLGEHWIRAGKYDAAIEAFETAEATDPDRPGTHFGRFELGILREGWREAEAAMKPLTSLRSPTSKWEALRRLALVSLYRGKAADALELLDQAASAYEYPRTRSAAARTQAARVLLAQGEAERALELARSAQREGEGNYPEWEGLFYEASALAASGRIHEAEARAAKLLERTESMPTQKETRRHHHLVGEIALARDEPQAAIVELEKARSLLLPRGFTLMGRDPPPHVPIWYSLGLAYLAAGRDGEALVWFERITESEGEHIWWPIPYVRSFYFLGRIHESLGDQEAASGNYRRFHELWKDGDLDRERIEETREKLTRIASSRG
ncbi:MAG TPA: tetratricopeptide repeat protein, partial [Vicinamibacteria bacterium]|nr:tetratricopeptide repeat protein [Vicinamibacteria bacterium]